MCENDKKVCELLDNLRKSIQKHWSEVEEDSGKHEPSVDDQETFWKKLQECAACISQDASKISLSCSALPFPDCQNLHTMVDNTNEHFSLLTDICRAYKAKINCSDDAPCGDLSYGNALSKHIYTYVQTLCKQFIALIESLTDDNLRSKRKYLPRAGVVWETVENCEDLPKNNAEAVLQDLQTTHDLITDAFDELNQAIGENEKDNDDDDDDDTKAGGDADDDMNVKWRNEDVEVAKSILGLLKTVQASLSTWMKKLKKFVLPKPPTSASDFDEVFEKLSIQDETAFNAIIDGLPPKASAISSLVDDLVSSLYSPEKEYSSKKVKELNELLTSCISIHQQCFQDAESQSKTDFMFKALEHNVKKCTDAIEKA